MQVFDIVLLALLGTAFVVSVIELGISGYLDHSFNDVYGDEDYYYGYYYYTDYKAPAQLKYLVFCSVWSLFVTIALIVAPLIFGRKAGGKGGLFTVGTLVLNGLTWIFWLAGFAALADYYNGSSPGGILGALLAFAVIPWIVFTAFLVINLLTAFGVITVDRFGYQPLFRSRAGAGPSSATPMTTTAGAQPAV